MQLPQFESLNKLTLKVHILNKSHILPPPPQNKGGGKETKKRVPNRKIGYIEAKMITLKED